MSLTQHPAVRFSMTPTGEIPLLKQHCGADEDSPFERSLVYQHAQILPISGFDGNSFNSVLHTA